MILVDKLYENHAAFDDVAYKEVHLSRDEAIRELRALEDEGDETEDYESMTNEQLGQEICLAGIVHDDFFGGVHDIDDMPEGEYTEILPDQ